MDGINKFGPVWSPPTRFVPIGHEFVRYGRRLLCVERPKDTWPPLRACKGCFFRRSEARDGVIINCKDIQCSSFDRRDRKNVWFIDQGEDVGKAT